MKRIYMTVALLGALVTGAFAQRNVDVGAVMVYPTPNPLTDTVKINCNMTDSIRETVIIINYGPDMLLPSDTVLLGSPATSGLNSFYAITGDTVLANDTIAILNRKISYSQINWFAQVDANSNFVEVDKADFADGQFYLWMNLIQLSGYAGANPDAVDTNQVNDQGAIALVQYACSPTSIKDIKNGASLNVFPNPATNQINFNYNFVAATATSALRVTDISGRVVKTMTLGRQNAGNKSFNVDIADLNNGMYYIELTTDQSRSIAKFTKN